jgi:type II secretory pathway component PulM
MNDDQLPEGLARLERALERRPLARPPAGLRLRALGQVQRARARERNLQLAAAAAVVLAVGWLGLSMPATSAESSWAGAGLAQAEARALEGLGYGADDARRLAYAAYAVELPRLAPPLGSGASVLATEGGL